MPRWVNAQMLKAGSLMKKLYEMPFAEFAERVKASGAVNRVGQEARSYSVYMNGPITADLPPESLDHEFPEERVRGLTETVGLNALSFRDNLRVAELFATRNAWMSAVLDASSRQKLAPEVLEDYDALSDGLDHPWIRGQINAQRALAEKLAPALKAAEEASGRSVTDQIPKEISQGKIVSQNTDFTVQATGNGVVAHENRRLAAVPAVGQDVTVVYYRGNGQVFDNGQQLAVSAPFIDAKTGDLAVNLLNGKAVHQVVLFNGVATFAKFVEQQQLDKQLVAQAIDARTAMPKRTVEKLPEGVKAVTAGRHVGLVVDVTKDWVVQKAAPSVFVAHKRGDFEQLPEVGSKLDVQYSRDGKAVVLGGKAQGCEMGR